MAVGDGAVPSHALRTGSGWGVPDAPADALTGAGEDFVLAALDFMPELAGAGVSFGVSVGDDIVEVAAGFDGGEEVPADVGLGFWGSRGYLSTLAQLQVPPYVRH